MRQIKFRAWDGKYMHQDTSTHTNEPGDITPWTYMQFTGLRDKNGKEIYEGDIVKLTDSVTIWPRDPRFDRDIFEMVAEVRWDNEGADFEMSGPDVRGFTNAQIIEVVGNIYETPSEGNGGK